MKIGIICASDDELSPFLPHIENCQTTQKAMLTFYEGKINHHEVVALYSGVCKVNAAIASQILIDTFHIEMMINSGTCGAMDLKLNILDTVISTEVCYHDVAEDTLTQFHPWLETIFFKADPKLVQLSKIASKKVETKGKVFWGRMVTGEAFITSDGREYINDTFKPLTVDMETGSIAHVCYVNNVKFIAIRCVTDTPNHSGIGVFEDNCIKASMMAQEITLSLIKEIPLSLQ